VTAAWWNARNMVNARRVEASSFLNAKLERNIFLYKRKACKKLRAFFNYDRIGNRLGCKLSVTLMTVFFSSAVSIMSDIPKCYWCHKFLKFRFGKRNRLRS